MLKLGLCAALCGALFGAMSSASAAVYLGRRGVTFPRQGVRLTGGGVRLDWWGGGGPVRLGDNTGLRLGDPPPQNGPRDEHERETSHRGRR
jgi:hypothetical protein